VIDEIRKRNIRPENNRNEGGSYSFEETVKVDVHFETFQSLDAKLELYGMRSIRGVAFWRIGQEPEGFWKHLIK